MPSKPTKFSKNTLSLDLVIRHRILPKYWLCFVCLMLLLAGWAKLAWWQYVLIALLIVVLITYQLSRKTVVALSCTHSDELWDIGVLHRRQQLQCAGYLSKVEHLSLMNRAVFLRFYVIEPKRQYLDVIIHRRDVSDEDFRKLSGLALLS